MPLSATLPRISTNVRFAASALLFPELAGAWAERLFLTPPRPKDGVATALDLIDARNTYVEHKGRHIATWRWGSRDAPAVLLAHGWGGHAAQMRAFVFPLLSAGYRVIAYDQPAHGVSDGKLTGLGKSLKKSTWAAEERKRRRFYENGTYHWLNNDTEQQAITMLVREAAAEGVGVILQAPPVTALYHAEMSPMLGITPDFEAFKLELEALADELPNVVWHDAHADPSYALADFTDWVHLSKRGARRYVRALIDASNDALRAERQAR